MLILEEIDKVILSHSKTIYQRVKQNEELDDIIQEIISKQNEIYKLNDEDILSISQKYFLNQYVVSKINETKRDLLIRFEKKKTIIEKVEQLKNLELPEQRSKEWFEMRDKMLTASSLADALGKGHFKNRETLLIEKTSKEPPKRFGNAITEWGVKYEQVATTFYEKLNNLTIVEFGLIPHPELKVFGASPDGICDIDSPEDYIGRMLEIKCPPKRQFTEDVPAHYWMQMQGQLESCDLEECDFLQVKLKEYETTGDYNEDKYEEDGVLMEGVTSDNLPKGLLLTFIYSVNGETKYHYEYCEFYKSYEELKEWSFKTISNYDKNYDTIQENWWKINHYECTLVGRDRKWWLKTMPEILNFWEDVEHYRKVGNQELLDKKEGRKRNKKEPKPKKEKNIITINKEITQEIESTYLLDSD
jgi:putative phage-type endonuclease